MTESNKAVFLSYASQDADAARKICETLRGAGVEVWFDADGGLEHGDEWDAKIRRQIKECVLFIPLISAHTQARLEGYFRLEWELAAQRAMSIASGVPFILPVVIDDTRESEALVPDRFRAVQWTKLPGGMVTPEVKARYLKLWSHRIGAVEEGRFASAQDRTNSSPDIGAYQAPLRRRRWFAATVAIAAGAGIAVWFFAGRNPSTPITGSTKAETQSAKLPSAPMAPTEARKLVLQARALIDDDWLAVRENFRLADELCERATKLDPTDGEAWATWGRVSAMLINRDYDTTSQRRDGARSRAERAMQLAPESIEAGLAMALVLAQSGSSSDAAQRLRDLLARAPMDARVARALATTLSPPGKSANAEATEIRLHHPSFGGRDPRPLFDEARTMYDTRKRLAESEELMARANTLAPCWEGYAWNLVYHINGSTEGHLESAMQIARDLPPRLLQEDVFAALIATMWYYHGDGEKALTALARVPRDFIEDRWCYFPKGSLMGDAYRLSGRSAAAQEQWKQALGVVEKRLAAESTNIPMLVEKALLLAKLGRKEEALKTWQLATELGRVLYSATTLSKIHLALGDREPAIQALRAGLFPVRDVAITSINFLRLDPWFEPIRSDPRVAEIITDALALIARKREKPAPSDEKASDAPRAAPGNKP